MSRILSDMGIPMRLGSAPVPRNRPPLLSNLSFSTRKGCFCVRYGVFGRETRPDSAFVRGVNSLTPTSEKIVQEFSVALKVQYR